MSTTGGEPGAALVVRRLLGAGVQFVVVGDTDVPPLRLVVARHPTNLDALGRVLDDLGAQVRAEPPTPPGPHAAGPQRVGDPLATVRVATSAGEVDLLFGGPRHSLYAQAVTAAQARAVAGVVVQWVATVPAVQPVSAVTSRMLGRRLLSLAEGLARRRQREGDEERDTAARPDDDGGDAGS